MEQLLLPALGNPGSQRNPAGGGLCHLAHSTSGGARHEFETYLLISKVGDLAAGAYHYLPMEHALELLHPVENMEAVISDALCGQSWAAKANVVFFWTIVAYRAEWRWDLCPSAGPD